ncbi:MAG: hypothetical protein QX199_20675 [Methylococcaceae bacterium]
MKETVIALLEQIDISGRTVHPTRQESRFLQIAGMAKKELGRSVVMY